MGHAGVHDILYPQHGFKQRTSSETQLIEFIDDTTVTNMDSGKQTDALVMDFLKALDKVSHSL